MVLKVTLVLALGLCCFFQVKESVDKFISKKKATVSSTREQPTTSFPTVTICNKHPYKNESVIKKLYNGLNNSIDETEKAWSDGTFSLSELVSVIFMKINGSRIICNTTEYASFKSCIDAGLEVTPISTLYKGMCYSFHLIHNVTSQDILFFSKYTELDGFKIEPVAIIHPEGQQLSVSTLTWRGSPFEVKLEENAEIDLSIVPQEYRYSSEDGNCDPQVTESQFFNCFKSYVKTRLLSKDFADLHCNESRHKFGNCTSVQTWYFSEPRKEVEICKSGFEYKCAFELAYQAGKHILSNSVHPCKKPCHVQNFAITKSTITLTSVDNGSNVDDSFVLMMYLTTTNVEVYEEYLLFDLNSIISSVGGSLGLFLSFSFLGFFLGAFDFLKSLYHSLNKS